MKHWQLVTACLLAWPALAHAELYSYTDAAGVVHFTNLAPPAKTQAVPQRDNTWLWEDDAGQLQRLHRVDVGSFDRLIEAAATYYTLPPALIKAVIAVESHFDANAVSVAGAQGLMQLLPATARDMFVEQSYDPSDNIFGGTRYLRLLANRFAGDLRLTVAAYNCGPEAVVRAGGIPNIAETQAYVRRVLALYRHYSHRWKAVL